MINKFKARLVARGFT